MSFLSTTLLVASLGATPAEPPAPSPTLSSPRRDDPARILRLSRVSVDWRDAALPEALDDLGRQLRLNLVLAPAAAELREESVRLKLDRARGRTVLKLLADQFDFKVLQVGSVLLVTTPEDAVKRTAVLRIYDLRPILYVPPDFPGPRIGLRPPGEFEDEPPPREIRREGPDPSEIVDLLRRGTGEASWEFDAVSIDAMGHTLVVRHSPSMHARISRILAGLGPF